MKRLFTMLIVMSMAVTVAWAQNDLNLTFEDDSDLANWSHHDEANAWSTEAWDATAGMDTTGGLVFGDGGYTFLVKRPVTATQGSHYIVSIDIKNPSFATAEFNLEIQGLSTDVPMVEIATDTNWVTYQLHGVADLGTAGYIRLHSLGSTEVPTVTIDNVMFDDDVPEPAPLFFSQYAEGSSYNKFLEIYNPTDAAVSLKYYAFPNVSNDTTVGGEYEWWQELTSTASIAAGDVYVIADSRADAAILAEADQTHNFLSNGDDGFALVYGLPNDFTPLDWVGDWWGDPGSGWDVAGVVAGTKDHTLTRKDWVARGNDWGASAGTDSVNSEWIVTAQDDWTGLGSHTFAPNNVTFSVNMGWQMILGTFDPATDFIDVAGSFNGWSGNTGFNDEDGDSVYTFTIPLAPGAIEYKYRINGSWDTSENLGANRAYTVVAGDQTIPTVYYSDQEPGPTQDLEVLISVDMTVQLLNGNFRPDSGDVIVIRGGHDQFGNWGGATAMTLSTSAANVYEYVASFSTLPVGSGFEYKFVILTGGDPDAAIWEGSPNRSFAGDGSETDTDANGFAELTMPVEYFADVTPADIITQDVTVTFSVNLASAYNAMWFGGILIDTQTGTDDISAWDQVNGVAINGILSQWWDWGNDPTCVGEWAMTQSSVDEFVYTFDYLFTAGQAKVQNYKYGINSLDNEAGFAQNREMTIDDAAATFAAPVDCFGSQNTDENLPFPEGCVPTTVEGQTELLPEAYALNQNYPNPFNPTTTISFALPEASNVKLTIYNALGQEVRTLKSEHFNAGSYSVNWNGLDNAGNTISSGIYIYTLTAGEQNFSKKMLMLK